MSAGVTGEIIAKALGGRKTGGGWMARCPAHDDREPSCQAAAADARTRFVVVLEGAAGADTAHVHTLRYLLKYLLRSRGLRCIEARQLERNNEGGEQ